VVATCGGCARSSAEQAHDAPEPAAAAKSQAGAPAAEPKEAADGKEDAKAGAEAKEPAEAKEGADAKEPADAKEGAEGKEGKEHEVKLTPEQVTKLGVAMTAAQATHYSAQPEGFGVAITHDAIAQAASELQTALASVRLSDKTYDRAKRLADGPGSLGVDALETAQRQQATDQAAVRLAQRKLTVLLGIEFPWHGEARDAEIEKLAEGSHRLVRVTFPPGGPATRPKALRVSSLDAAAGSDWTARTVWVAPQDPTLPGQSVFALLTSADLAEGAHIRAQSLSDSSTAGVVVPETAVVINEGQYWCYVKKEKEEGVFQRVAIDASRSTGAGYFVSEGVDAGDEVVTTGAGLLLARELNASTGAED
jgi:hypothetical protein